MQPRACAEKNTRYKQYRKSLNKTLLCRAFCGQTLHRVPLSYLLYYHLNNIILVVCYQTFCKRRYYFFQKVYVSFLDITSSTWTYCNSGIITSTQCCSDKQCSHLQKNLYIFQKFWRLLHRKCLRR